MSMKREEIIKEYENAVVASGLAAAAGNEDAAKSYELFKAGLSALRPVSREQVEKVWRGEWIIGEPDVLGVPIHCSRCGWGSDHADQRAWMEYKGHIFCGHCGAPMTDEAVEMVMERLEGVNNG